MGRLLPAANAQGVTSDLGPAIAASDLAPVPSNSTQQLILLIHSPTSTHSNSLAKLAAAIYEEDKHKMSSSKTSQPAPPAPSSRVPAPSEMEIPRDQDVVKQVASPMATLSSHVDPYPHYIMSGACEYSRGRPRDGKHSARSRPCFLSASTCVALQCARLGVEMRSEKAL